MDRSAGADLLGSFFLWWNRRCNPLLVIYYIEGPKPATRGGEWEPIKISPKFELSAYIPKPPQTLEPRSARIAMNKLSRSKKTRVTKRKQKRENFSNWICSGTDRSDRYRGPVWPVKKFKNRQTGLTGLANRSDRWRPENPENSVPKPWIESKSRKTGWNLEDSFVPTPRVYTQEISP